MRDELMERANRKALFEHIAARAIEVTVAPQPIRSLPVVYAADGGRVRSLTTSKFGVRRARRLERHTTHDTRHTTRDTRHTAHDTRHTTLSSARTRLSSALAESNEKRVPCRVVRSVDPPWRVD
jgi:hypothetical protein